MHKQTNALVEVRVVTSYVHPTLFYNGEYLLLILSSVLLIELGCLAVGWAVGVGLVQEALQRERLYVCVASDRSEWFT